MSTQLQENQDVISGLPSTDYYAPDFRVLVEGKELDATSHGDILDLNVTMDIKTLTSFSFTVNNWDDRSFDFKYSDTTTFDIGKRVDIQMGYANQLRFMASGIIQTLAPRFPESGSPTLAVSGADRRVKLKERKPKPGDIRKFVNKTDWQIAQIIAERNHLDSRVTRQGKAYPVVYQSLDDLKFLMSRASLIDFDFYLRVDPVTGKDTLFFVSPTDNRDARRTQTYIFEWGKNLINYSTQLSLTRQVSNVTVRGWDPATKQSISYTARPSDLPDYKSEGSNGPQMAKSRLDDRQDFVVNHPVSSTEEARELAISRLRERAYQYLTGTGRVIGLPDLRPGDVVELHGLGQRFSGTSAKRIQYAIQKATHTLGSSGYQTQFEVRSTVDGGTRQGSGGAGS